jgi:hypothetical protein
MGVISLDPFPRYQLCSFALALKRVPLRKTTGHVDRTQTDHDVADHVFRGYRPDRHPSPDRANDGPARGEPHKKKPSQREH